MNPNYWNDQNSPVHPISAPDFIPAKLLRELQLHRLQRLVEYTYERVSLFRARCDERGVKPHHVRTLKDIALLPCFSKADLRDTYPFGLFAAPMKDIVRFHASSGTTGKPIVSATPPTTCCSGARPSSAASPPAASAPATSSRTPTATASSPAVSASTRARRIWASPSFPSPAATRTVRSCSCATSA